MTAPVGTGGAGAELATGTVQPKPWGHETMFADGSHGYVGKLLVVTDGQSLSLQYHRDKDETMLVLSGQVLLEHGPAEQQLQVDTLRAGDTVHLPPGVRHRLTAVGDAVLAEVSSAAPGWRQDIVRLDDRYGRTGTSAP
ncbi:cupin domain-containing protein [Cellulomonas citrea]|uniref:cupin domain-containing protein n=1 Tax=Cellulomonas citrea TaxID=1909423 RepID=UPI001357490F|nr:cupin domain-containing protein [Cellulomonas citrea]